MTRILSTMSLASAGVALIILFDLATGQAPPGLNSYMGGPQGPIADFGPINLGPMRQPFPIFNPGEEFNKNEKEYEKKDGGSLKHKEEKGGKSSGYDREYEDGKEGKDKGAQEPGMIGQFQNSMSDAWKSLTSLGRQTRSVRSISEKLIDGPILSAGRPIEDYEFRQYNNQGYIFFKVPKHLICSN